MLTLIENTVRVTIRHSDSEPIASAVATASISRGEATGTEWPSKPPAPDDRIMAEFLRCASESLATPENLQESPAILRRSTPENGKMAAKAAVIAAVLAVQASFSVQASETRPAGSSTAASGRQSMVTKPRVCSIRRNQARIAGNAARA